MQPTTHETFLQAILTRAQTSMSRLPQCHINGLPLKGFLLLEHPKTSPQPFHLRASCFYAIPAAPLEYRTKTVDTDSQRRLDLSVWDVQPICLSALAPGRLYKQPDSTAADWYYATAPELNLHPVNLYSYEDLQVFLQGIHNLDLLLPVLHLPNHPPQPMLFLPKLIFSAEKIYSARDDVDGVAVPITRRDAQTRDKATATAPAAVVLHESPAGYITVNTLLVWMPEDTSPNYVERQGARELAYGNNPAQFGRSTRYWLLNSGYRTFNVGDMYIHPATTAQPTSTEAQIHAEQEAQKYLGGATFRPQWTPFADPATLQTRLYAELSDGTRTLERIHALLHRYYQRYRELADHYQLSQYPTLADIPIPAKEALLCLFARAMVELTSDKPTDRRSARDQRAAMDRRHTQPPHDIYDTRPASTDIDIGTCVRVKPKTVCMPPLLDELLKVYLAWGRGGTNPLDDYWYHLLDAVTDNGQLFDPPWGPVRSHTRRPSTERSDQTKRAYRRGRPRLSLSRLPDCRPAWHTPKTKITYL